MPHGSRLFFEKAFVRRVNRRIAHPHGKVLALNKAGTHVLGSGLPLTVFMSQPIQVAGEYRL